MKKTLSILLAVVVMFALAIPVFAADNLTDEAGTGTDSTTVTATLVDGNNVTDVATVYYVTVEWDVQSQLKYTLGNTTYEWNATDTKYIPSTADAVWSGEATVGITVTNQSNADISAKADWESENGITATCTFANDGSATVSSAATGTDLVSDVKKLDGAPVKGTINGTVTVSAGSIESTGATVGTVTLSISKVD